MFCEFIRKTDRFAYATLEDRSLRSLEDRSLYSLEDRFAYATLEVFKALRADLQTKWSSRHYVPIYKPKAIFKALRADLPCKRLIIKG